MLFQYTAQDMSLHTDDSRCIRESCFLNQRAPLTAEFLKHRDIQLWPWATSKMSEVVFQQLLKVHSQCFRLLRIEPKACNGQFQIIASQSGEKWFKALPSSLAGGKNTNPVNFAVL